VFAYVLQLGSSAIHITVLIIYFLCVFYVVCNVVVVPVSKMNFCPLHLNRQ